MRTAPLRSIDFGQLVKAPEGGEQGGDDQPPSLPPPPPANLLGPALHQDQDGALNNGARDRLHAESAHLTHSSSSGGGGQGNGGKQGDLLSMASSASFHLGLTPASSGAVPPHTGLTPAPSTADAAAPAANGHTGLSPMPSFQPRWVWSPLRVNDTH